MQNDEWTPEVPSKTTVMDDDDAFADEAREEPDTYQASADSAPLTGGIPKGGVFHL